MPEGEEKDQVIENLFEKVMKENVHNLVKGITYKSRKPGESEEVGPKEEHTKARHH